MEKTPKPLESTEPKALIIQRVSNSVCEHEPKQNKIGSIYCKICNEILYK